jgi:hypothetical protein
MTIARPQKRRRTLVEMPVRTHFNAYFFPISKPQLAPLELFFLPI